MHLSVKNGAKGKGASHAQYIEREGKYANREDKVLSKSGNMPSWVKSPKDFWKAADEYERANGRTYKELEISLPRELTAEQQIELVQEFTKNVLGDEHAYTWSIHAPKAQDGEQNAHVHLMFTERTNDGIERSKDQFFKRYNPNNPELGGAGKNRLFNHRAFVASVREEWSITANHALARHGIDARIDHRSYKDMEIDLESQNVKRLFANADNIDSTSTFKLSGDLQEKQRLNGARIIENPNDVLKVLTDKSSTFKKRDLERYILSHTDGEDQYLEAYNRVLGSIQIQTLDDDTNSYTTSDMLQVERELVDTVKRSNSINKEPSFNERIAFTGAFKTMEKRSAERGKVVEPEQKAAFNTLTSNGQIAIVNGAAGTGKSFVLQGVREAYENAGYSVIGTAVQGKTALDMKNDAGIESRTLASLLSTLRKEELNNKTGEQATFNNKTVLVIDEAGMVGSQDMREILGYAEKNDVKVRMVGDAYQLNAVSAGRAFGKVQETLKPENQTSLNKIVRQNDDKHLEASIAMSKHDIKTGIAIHTDLGNVKAYDTQDEARLRVVTEWANSPKFTPPDENGNTRARTSIMLAYTRNDVNSMNDAARVIKRDAGALKGDDFTVQTEFGKRNFAIGDEVVFNKPNREIGVLNGTRGQIESVQFDKNGSATSLEVRSDGKPLKVDLADYNNINHGYASTIHKAQGVTVDDAYVLASPNMNANLTYVANTRHRDNLSFVYSREQFKNNDELVRSLSKAEEKTFSIDFNVVREHKDVQARITERETLAGRSLYHKRGNVAGLSIQERIARSKGVTLKEQQERTKQLQQARGMQAGKGRTR